MKDILSKAELLLLIYISKLATRLLTIRVITTDVQLMSLLVSFRDVCAIKSNLNVTMGYNNFKTNIRV